jgi:uncharacterized protein (TIGR00369 family)
MSQSGPLRRDVDAPEEAPAGYIPCPLPVGDFGDSLGTLFMRPDGTGFACRMRPGHRNPRGAVHGGVLLSLADQVLGLTVYQATGQTLSATVNLNCDFVEAAFPGDLIEGEARVTRITGSIVFVQGSLRRGERLILTASGIWKRLQHSRQND